jgi:MarR family transcriptional regulator, organic hydroperoxide resistance regulator
MTEVTTDSVSKRARNRQKSQYKNLISSNNTYQFVRSEGSTGFLLWQVTKLWQREIKKELEKYNLTYSEFIFLTGTYWLILNKQIVTHILLSSHVKMNQMRASIDLRRLQNKGLLKQHEHLTDTRSKIITLTDAGLKVIKEVVNAVELFDQVFFQPLADKENDLNVKLNVLLENKISI